MNARTLLAALIVVGGASPIAGQLTSPNADLIQRSGFIFKGTVQKNYNGAMSNLKTKMDSGA